MTTIIKQYALLEKFSCLGADCPDTCCRQWDMPLDQQRLELYRQKAPELLAAVDEATHLLKRNEKDECVKFAGGLCGIQKKYGAEYLGDACYFYPRFHRRLGEEIVLSASLSCPETARLALFGNAPFALKDHAAERIPVTVKDTKPANVATQDALNTVSRLIDFAGDTTRTPERIMAYLVSASPDIVRWEHMTLEPVIADSSDPQAIYYAFALLLATAPEAHRRRLADILKVMEHALGCRMNWATRELEPTPMLRTPLVWQEPTAFGPILRRWVQAEIAFTSFPFTGGKLSPFEHSAVLAMRFATVRLALLCHGKIGLEAAARIIQSIARFHDHLANSDLSLQIYRDAKWLKPGRLRGLVGDIR